MRSVNNLKQELELRRASLRRWQRYVGGFKPLHPNLRQESLAKKYISKLEKQIHELDEELREREKIGIFSTKNLFEIPGKVVNTTLYGVEQAISYFSHLSPRHLLKKIYLGLVALSLAYIFLKSRNMTGYVVLETVTNSNYSPYFLMLVLILCLFAFCRLYKE